MENTKRYTKPPWLVFAFLFFSFQAAGQSDGIPATVVLARNIQQQLITGRISYRVDSTENAGISTTEQAPFSTVYSSFISSIRRFSPRYHFWIKFDLANQSDSLLSAFLYCGDINFVTLYFIPENHRVEKVSGGNLTNSLSYPGLAVNAGAVVPFHVLPHDRGELFLEIVQKTEDFDFDGVYIYDRPGLYETMGEDFEGTWSFILFQILFQGILWCQLIYTLFQWMIIRQKEYLYYGCYLLVIVLYFLSKYERLFTTDFLFSRYPLLTVYLNKTLLILPYFFYFRFVRSFLEMPASYPVMNRWIRRIEYFLLAYLLFDLLFVLYTFNVRLQREIYSYTLFAVFLASVAFTIYLFGQKKTLIYYILTGSLFVGLGNIVGLVLTFLENEGIVRNISYKLIFSQVGIILEIFCFTAGLSYKSLAAEKEKIKSREKLIDQLKANEQLQNKMQTIRNSIAQDLHDDIGSTLSSISILSNLALKEKNRDQTLLAMAEIKDSSVSLMEKMDDIVWSINPRNDSLENLLLRVKHFASTLFEAKNIDYTITLQENLDRVKLPMEWRQHIYLICKEVINNLVKYSGATEAVIRVSQQAGKLDLLIRDNGRGFDLSVRHGGNGLLSIRNRAAAMQANLDIQSAEGSGTSVMLSVKIE